MADIEDTPPATLPLPTAAATRPLPPRPTPATLPDQADLRPAGPARRWTWLLGGITAGAGAAALVLSLVATLVSPAATAPAAAAATSAATSATASSPASAQPADMPYTRLAKGCSLMSPATVDRYAAGATCTEASTTGGDNTSRGLWNTKDPRSGYTSVQVEVQLGPMGESVYQQMLTVDRSTLPTGGLKITEDRAVPGLGDKAALIYSTGGGVGRVDLMVLQRNALVSVTFTGATLSGYTPQPLPSATAEAAATACAQDALATLTTS
ncbi:MULTISPECIES: hypothetical protein [unclassified Kitasatospora]|uniref:hypothetical protein n=1 Tax=unclassified Kitasatospora TaxID=2633591 RepID=UPI0033D87CE3